MQQEKDHAKPKTFTARINRHLLFNTLNAAVALCRRRPEEAAELLIHLSDCLQYTSEEKPALVFLQDELEFVRSYLYVQSIRFGKRLHINDQIDDVSPVMIPPYAVYTILENVFEHVMMKTTQGVTVTIAAEPEDGQTSITVRDNGAGIAKAKLDHFMEEYQGHSLEQLNRILEQNGMRGLQIRSREGQGTSVTLYTARRLVE